MKYVIHQDWVCLYYSNGKNNSYRFNLGVKISNFNEKVKLKIKNSLKKNIIPPELSTYQSELENVINFFNEEISSFKVKNLRKPTIQELKDLIKKRNNVSSNQEKTFLSEYLNEFLEVKKDKFNHSGTMSSFKDYLSFLNSILDFQKFKRKNLEILDFNLILLKEYYDFMVKDRPKNQKFITRGKLDGKTLNKRFSTLKSFYEWCSLYKKLEVKGIIDNIKIFRKEYNFQSITKDVIGVSLTPKQVQLIKNYPFENLSNKEQKSREMFLVVLYTGMRISDLTTLKKEHIIVDEGKFFLKRKSIKTKTEYEVELNKYIYEILEKNDFNMKLLSDQKANEGIKVFLSKIPEFNEETKFLNTDENPSRNFKLYEVITFHQGRRTFITNLIDLGVPISEIKSITDHKRVGTIEKYISWKSRNKKRRLNLYDED